MNQERQGLEMMGNAGRRRPSKFQRWYVVVLGIATQMKKWKRGEQWGLSHRNSHIPRTLFSFLSRKSTSARPIAKRDPHPSGGSSSGSPSFSPPGSNVCAW